VLLFHCSSIADIKATKYQLKMNHVFQTANSYHSYVIVIQLFCIVESVSVMMIVVMVLCAIVLRLVTNRYLIVQPPCGQDVEWGYCFDIHLNAFFPLLMILHFFQLPFLRSMRSFSISAIELTCSELI